MQSILKNKNILIFTSSSIAIYKILDLINTLQKDYYANVRIVLSQNATKFITPLCFEALTHNTALTQDSQNWTNECNHIGYAKWADIALIAPASANTIAKITNGIADSVFLSTILATSAPKILAPAMNTAMLNAPQTKNNLDSLKQMGYEILPTRISLLACGDVGDGAMASNSEIIFALMKMALKNSESSRFWQDRDVIVSGGASIEKIDDVRFISNFSSGKQANSLSLALHLLGAKVHLFSSASTNNLPQSIQIHKVSSVSEFKSGIFAKLDSLNASKIKPFIFMAAALSDFIPTYKQGKIKKQDIKDSLNIICQKADDILESIPQDRAFKVGFKAECDEKLAQDFAKNMLVAKSCDVVCLNVISSKNPFGSDENCFKLIAKNAQKDIQRCSKFACAMQIAEFVSKIYDK